MQEAREQSLAPLDTRAEPLRVLVPSPLGSLGVELRQTVVTRLVIEPPEPARPAYIPLQHLDGSEFLDEVFGRLSEYFAGARRKLDLEFDLAPSHLSGFARRVLRETSKIPYGKTRTYPGLAELCGRRGAQPEVLDVLLGNPIPILVPCHRVTAGEAGLGGYVAGTDRKHWLLELESRVSRL